MENGAWRRTLAGILAAAQTAALCLCGGIRAAAAEEDADPAETHRWSVADTWRDAGIAAYGGEDIVLPIDAATGANGSAAALQEIGGRQAVVSEADGTLHFLVDVPQDALYAVQITWRAMNERPTDVQRSLLVDGALPYAEMGTLRFARRFISAGEPRTDVNGDESAPRMEQVLCWQTVTLCDSTGYEAGPLTVRLTAGQHTIALEGAGVQPMAVADMRLIAPPVLPSYAEVAAEYAARGLKPADSGAVTEGEDTAWCSAASLRATAESEITCTPHDDRVSRLNAIGGSSWKSARQTIAWTVDVPQDGLYTLSLHMYAYHNYGDPSYRQIAIDGQVPFKELSAYRFRPDSRWRTETLCAEDGTPFSFYLTAGQHELTMSIVAGEMTQILRRLTEDMDTLSALYLDITLVTTGDPDPNYDYRLAERVPGLTDTLDSLCAGLQECIALLSAACGSEQGVTAGEMRTTLKDLELLRADVFEIPGNLDRFTTILSKYGSWLTALAAGTMTVDSLQLTPAGETAAQPHVGFFARLRAGIVSFFTTFGKDYSAVSAGAGDADGDPIEVWYGGTQIWAVELRDLIDSGFSAETGRPVRFKLVPSTQMSTGINAMLLAILTGTAPDAVLGAASLSDYAMRGQCYDLSRFSDFDEVKERFFSACFTPLTYRGAVYGLPEKIELNVMFYRTDLLQKLGLSVPQTWDDVLHTVIPRLAENGMTVSGSPGYETLLFQLGGELYNADMTESAVASQVSWQAFKRHCDFYTMYGVPRTMDFFNRFRSGEVPLGFGGLATYLQFLYAAPELSGRVGVAVMPGTVREDGTVDRTIGSILAGSSMIMADAKDPDGAWQFLKWYSDTDTQVELSARMEARLDMSARLMSADREAFSLLDWDRQVLPVFLSAADSAKAYPPVLGDYYTTRYIGYAFNYVTVSKTMTEREALEYAQKNIDTELLRRRSERQ